MSRRNFSTYRIATPSRTAGNALNRPQRRGLHLSDAQSKRLLQDQSVNTSEADSSTPAGDQRFLAVTVDRTNRCPAIMASPTTDPKQMYARAKTFPYKYTTGPPQDTIEAVLKHLQISSSPPQGASSATKLIKTLTTIFKEKEAYALSTYLTTQDDSSLVVHKAAFSFDNSAFKSGRRQQDIHSLRDTALEDPDEVFVEGDGIVYIKLDDPSANVGTLINGAGLAMNATDVLSLRGASPTNFLDTGGKATSETVRQSFEVILRDDRVKVIFVNIFGGLTLCDMIAEGIMLAFKDLNMKIPVVVRLRGTNEDKGQKMIAESGLPLHAFDDFSEAADKCIELAKQSS